MLNSRPPPPLDRPITYLYNTFHYYERKLREQPSLKRKLVQTVLGAQKENRPQGWCLSEMYHTARKEGNWTPDDSYYCKLIARLVDNILHYFVSASRVSVLSDTTMILG